MSKRWEWFFQTKEAHPRTVRVIATDLEKARSLAKEHLGTKTFHKVNVRTFIEPGCDSHTIEEPVQKPKPEEIRTVLYDKTFNELFGTEGEAPEIPHVWK